MKIDSVVVLCWAGDFRLARICLASVRYFYPDIPLFLMKDITKGDFDTRELERCLQVTTAGLSGRYGKFFGKIDLLFRSELGRFLFIDADQIMVGPVIEELEKVEAQFVVEPDPLDEASPIIDRLYYDRRRLREWDPAYRPPRFHFNSGQWVAPAGVLTRDDFAAVAEWREHLTIRDPATFCMTDQSLLNYIFHKRASAGRITVRPAAFMHLARTDYFRSVSLEAVRARKGRPLLFHWAGEHKSFLFLMKRSDLLDYFESDYYRRIAGGRWLQAWRSLRATPANSYAFAYWLAGIAKRRMKSWWKKHRGRRREAVASPEISRRGSEAATRESGARE